jgi:apolipoprotein N-acyltransferase
LTVAVVNDNSPPELRWTRERVDEYAGRILALAARVEDHGQAINIWNEGVLPWSYRPDDALLCAILESTPTPSRTFHLIGMGSDDDGHHFNSAYVLRRNGTVVDRYDKQNLLKGLEVPVLGSKLPFIFDASPYETPEPANRGIVRAGPLRMGIVICNEGMTSRVTASFAGTPYDLLVLIANDNWFEGASSMAHHFYLNRLRAIQCRKDLVINANLGISGHVSATGAIVHRRRGIAPFVEYYTIQTHGECL